jgi:hypothetical protein
MNQLNVAIQLDEQQLEALGELTEIRRVLERNLEDDDCEPLLPQALPELIREIGNIANAITPNGAAPAPDANGGFVASLTEAVMGCSSGLAAIANAIDRLASAVEAHGDQGISDAEWERIEKMRAEKPAP